MGTSVKSHQRLSNLNLPAKTSFHAVIAFATAAQYSMNISIISIGLNQNDWVEKEKKLLLILFCPFSRHIKKTKS